MNKNENEKDTSLATAYRNTFNVPKYPLEYPPKYPLKYFSRDLLKHALKDLLNRYLLNYLKKKKKIMKRKKKKEKNGITEFPWPAFCAWAKCWDLNSVLFDVTFLGPLLDLLRDAWA